MMKDINLKFVENGSFPECKKCYFDSDSCHAQCEDVGYYQLLKEEPKKIQSEYEHKLERYNLLFESGLSQYNDECTVLAGWIANNKPTNFQKCTKENTQVGDEVICNGNLDEKRIIKYIYCSSSSVVSEDNGKDKHGDLSYYEIDTYKNRGGE